MSRIIYFFLCICICISSLFTQGAFAIGDASKKTPSVLTADHVDMDKDNGIFTARGNVIVSQKGHVLHADVVTYNQNTDLVTASGHVRLEEPNGDVFFVRRVELTGDLRDGFLRDVKAILQDGSRLVAESGRRFDGAYAEFERSLYSPCQLCKGWPPTWRIRSRTSLWKEVEKDIEHTDAILEILGVPVFYSPFLTHPDASEDRRRGFLWPSIGGGGDLGMMIMIPYYIPFSEQHDVTLKPFLGTKAQILGAESRHFFSAGEMSLDGSVAHTDIVKDSNDFKSKSKRWHLKGDAEFALNATWRVGAKIERSSDPTYIKRFSELGIESLSTTKAYVEGFFGRSYTKAETIYFQGVRAEDEQSKIPTILPYIEGSWISQPSWQGSYWTLDGNFLGLSRKKGSSLNRLVSEGGWHLPYISPWGDIYQLSATLRGDIYKIKDFTPAGETSAINTTETRFLPKLHLRWEYPFYSSFIEDSSLIISPVASFTVSPNTPPKEDKIPNDDSKIFEIDDGNLFSSNRFNGFDRMDRGARLVYGLQFSLLGWGTNNLFVGQTYSIHRPREFLSDSGLGKRLSDYVLRLQVEPKPWFKIFLRGVYDQKTLRTKINGTTVTLGPPIFQVKGTYNFLAPSQNPDNKKRGEQIHIGASSQIHKNWTLKADTVKDLGKDSRTLSQSLSAAYKDDCFGLEFILRRSFFKEKDWKPSNSFLFKLSFKNLGDFRYTHTPTHEKDKKNNSSDLWDSFS